MSVLAVALLVWVRAIVPDFAGRTQEKTRGKMQEKTQTRRPASRSALSLPGVRAVLLVVLTFVLAHNLLYTYIASFLATASLGDSTDRVLLTFGIASLFGILIVGVLIDRHLRTLTLASTLLFAVATLMLARAGHAQTLVYASVAAWGLAFGGAATLFQTALAHAAGEATDAAQAVLVTVWNAAIAGGGMIGGVLLDRFSIAAFFPVLLGLLGVTFVVVWFAKDHGFPARTSRNPTEAVPAERCSR